MHPHAVVLIAGPAAECQQDRALRSHRQARHVAALRYGHAEGGRAPAVSAVPRAVDIDGLEVAGQVELTPGHVEDVAATGGGGDPIDRPLGLIGNRAGVMPVRGDGAITWAAGELIEREAAVRAREDVDPLDTERLASPRIRRGDIGAELRVIEGLVALRVCRAHTGARIPLAVVR